ncbi:MAG TPA: extracellular matrix/biofilm biosynthesis regulator RemA family protein [Bacillota bacterium]
MYLHLGGEHVIRGEEIVAIIQVDAARSPITREFLELLRAERRLVDLSGGAPKSCVITPMGAYLSAISTATLQKRCEDAYRFGGWA